MTDDSARTFGSDFRQFFFRGLVVLLPSVLTLWIVVKAYQFVDNTIAQPINRGVRIALVNVAEHLDPVREWSPFQSTTEEYLKVGDELGIRPFVPYEDGSGELFKVMDDGSRVVVADGFPVPTARVDSAARVRKVNAWWNDQWWTNGIGLVVAIIAVYLAGRFLGGFLGRRMYRRIEQFITTLPVFKQIYPYVKQVVDFLFNDDQPIKFNRVVAVEYPRKGIWSVGFMTGQTLRSVAVRAGDAVTVFVPSSPTPFTGYTITVNRADVIEIPISVDEAIRFAVSGGVLVPDHQVIRAGSEPSAPEENVGLIPIPGESVDPTDGTGDNQDEVSSRRDAG